MRVTRLIYCLIIVENLIAKFQILVTVLILTHGLTASTEPTILISAQEVEVTMFSDLDFFKSSIFDAESNNLIFITNQKVSVIQIYNEGGELEFQLPVEARMVKINRNIFGKGYFKLGFFLEDMMIPQYTNVFIK